MNSFEFAINMEHDAERYYTKQAEINRDNSLNTVFLLLAKDERNHAGVLQNKFSQLPYELKDNNTLSESRNVFKGIGSFKNLTEESPKQLDVYRFALEKEKQSIELYTRLLSAETDDDGKKLFEYLIKQEKDHFSVLEDLVLLINRPNEWVESAEFGIREEY